MSELIDNRAQRVRTLKTIIKSLHAGASQDEVRQSLKELVCQTDYSEIMAMEQELIAEGMPVSEIQGMCDLHSQVTRDVLITRGLLNSSLVHPREVFRAAIAEAAAGIILVHNHPSGDPTPSADDQAVTRQLVAAGELLDLPVYDHVIIAGDRFTSFATRGLL